MKHSLSSLIDQRAARCVRHGGRRILAILALVATTAWAAVWVGGHFEAHYVESPTWIYGWIEGHWTDPVEIPEQTETQWVEG